MYTIDSLPPHRHTALRRLSTFVQWPAETNAGQNTTGPLVSLKLLTTSPLSLDTGGSDHGHRTRRTSQPANLCPINSCHTFILSRYSLSLHHTKVHPLRNTKRTTYRTSVTAPEPIERWQKIMIRAHHRYQRPSAVKGKVRTTQSPPPRAQLRVGGTSINESRAPVSEKTVARRRRQVLLRWNRSGRQAEWEAGLLREERRQVVTGQERCEN